MLAEGPWRWPRLQNKGSMCEAQAARAASQGFEPRLLLEAFESRRRLLARLRAEAATRGVRVAA